MHLLFFGSTVLVGLNVAWSADPVKADIVIRDGMIYDGTGGQPFRGHVAVAGDRIVAVGAFAVAGSPEIVDVSGCAVMPGFIDLHNHSDRSITAEKSRLNANFLRQGCTAIVTGNCGGGIVDVESYFHTLESQGAGTHVVHLVPQGSVREQVMGKVDRPPTAEELEQMRRLVDKAMRHGAFGLSTGLIYVPGAYSSTDEIVELAKVVAAHGGLYVSHIRTEEAGVLAAIQEAMDIGQKAGCPVHISHLKASGPKAWGLGNDIGALIQAARQRGQKVTADQYPYTASSTSLEATVVPTWARAGGSDQLLARLADANTGPKLVDEIARELIDRGGGSRIQIAEYKLRPEWAGKTLLQLARELGTTPLDVTVEITRNGGASIINFSMSEEDVRLIAGRTFVATASDGSARMPGYDKPHPRSYGTFPRKIGDFAYTRGWLSVEQAVRSATGLPADILGLTDRGYVRPGAVADVVVCELGRLSDRATFENPHRYALGFRRVYVAGRAAVVDDALTGALAGRPIRRPTLVTNQAR
jgi:N-acyl-D-aspartate/D-glutamate deacylase